ncbi:MAG: hypothetical protein E3J78_03820 [Candidatus Cloacimonadota bacterium]|nr:MAG: hypothetical protein E3J78_03820 [Candidatus Cloacimonadota bacterium]
MFTDVSSFRRSFPHDIAVSPDGKYIYISSYLITDN